MTCRVIYGVILSYLNCYMYVITIPLSKHR